ncbi:hypothetical protein [Nocardioides lacusdianchii]|uniref:hypothetical protein n=1 Tax=Nocardioides lacusdianchii TaxID=2783664 RepID=UPI001CCABA1E|nr:hypothetical protein [Nocardioides lacusdianchii]
MRKFLVSAATVVAALTTLSVTPSAQATEIGYEGCTPGYWKNHTDNWQEMKSERLFGVVYTSAPTSVSGLTFLQALQARGGAGADGAAQILARASAAAYLNAAHEGLGYPWRRLTTGKDDRPALVATVNAAFASGDRDTMLALAARLDADNNLGCPLS